MNYKKDGMLFFGEEEAVDAICVGKKCDECPLRDCMYPGGCYNWATKNPEEFAKLCGFEIIREEQLAETSNCKYERDGMCCKPSQVFCSRKQLSGKCGLLMKTAALDSKSQDAKADGGKQRPLLVPTSLLRAGMAIREYGCQKYHDPDNWKRVEPERYKNAAYRHWLAYLDGEWADQESGLPHLWHLACNIAFLIEMERERETDGRVCNEAAVSPGD